MSGFYIGEGGVFDVLNERIVKLRKGKKITQEELANRIGVTRSALSQYELGTRQPDYETLQRMATFFDVSTDYLLGHSDVPSAASSHAVLEAHKNAAVIAEVADKLGIDLTDPAKRQQLEDIIRIIATDYADKTSKQ